MSDDVHVDLYRRLAELEASVAQLGLFLDRLDDRLDGLADQLVALDDTATAEAITLGRKLTSLADEVGTLRYDYGRQLDALARSGARGL